MKCVSRKTKSRTMEEIVETEWDSGLVGYLKYVDSSIAMFYEHSFSGQQMQDYD